MEEHSFSVPAAAIVPARETVLGSLGVPAGTDVNARTASLTAEAEALFLEISSPEVILSPIDAVGFAALYIGEGKNEPETPLAEIASLAKQLFLFALTLGPKIDGKIDSLFDSGNPALGSVLDFTASEGADRMCTRIESRVAAELPGFANVGEPVSVLCYSPGYCGWHISGQKKLFRALRPERIGITINTSCLMQPLKSISGVLVIGRPEIHRFDNSYEFCDACDGKPCRERIRKLGLR